MKCPFCKSDRVEAEFVDVGVGMVQATPYDCIDCGARQMNPYHDNSNASKEEIEVDWHKGQYWEVERCD